MIKIVPPQMFPTSTVIFFIFYELHHKYSETEAISAREVRNIYREREFVHVPNKEFRERVWGLVRGSFLLTPVKQGFFWLTPRGFQSAGYILSFIKQVMENSEKYAKSTIIKKLI